MSEIDKLIEAIEAKPELKGAMTQAEEEMRHGVKPPSDRGGRLPTFYRAEVDAIRADTRTISEVAETWGVSNDTINRVQQRGRFASVPYIPRDEVDRTLAYDGSRVQPPMAAYDTTPTGERGRPFKTGRRALTKEEKEELLLDHRTVKEIAIHYNISQSYVRRFRRENGVISRRDNVISEGLALAIRNDGRDNATIAKAFKLPVVVIEAIKNGEG